MQLRAEARDTVEVCALKTREAATLIDELRRTFTATPYRPTGLSMGSRALVRLVDELTWLSAILGEFSPATAQGAASDPDSSEVHFAAATVLDLSAELLADPRVAPDQLATAAEALRNAVAALEEGAVARLPSAYGTVGEEPGTAGFLLAVSRSVPSDNRSRSHSRRTSTSRRPASRTATRRMRRASRSGTPWTEPIGPADAE